MNILPNVTAQELRRYFVKQYYIDHVIELQLLVAALRESGANCNNENHVRHIWKFIRVFQDVWNTQIITKTENRKKAINVRTYLEWKYSNGYHELDEDVEETIHNIFEFYQMNRNFIRQKLGQISNYEQKFLSIEIDLFLLLQDRNTKHPYICNFNITAEVRNLVKTMSDQYNMDHVVELQILTHVLNENNIHNLSLISKFTNYFHKPWNIDVIEYKENERKGNYIRAWLNEVYNGGRPISRAAQEAVECVARHYRRHRNIILNFINSEFNLNGNEKQLLLNTEETLFELFDY